MAKRNQGDSKPARHKINTERAERRRDGKAASARRRAGRALKLAARAEG